MVLYVKIIFNERGLFQMKKRLLALVAAMVMVIGLVACSAPATVEEYYTQPAVKSALDSQIESMKGSYAGVYSDLGYEVSGNTFTYWFQFADQIEEVDAAALRGIEIGIAAHCVARVSRQAEDGARLKAEIVAHGEQVL